MDPLLQVRRDLAPRSVHGAPPRIGEAARLRRVCGHGATLRSRVLPPASAGTDGKVDCGFLFVRENRHRSDTRTIRLSVMVFHSRASQPAPDPVVFLPGGRGGSAVTRPLRSSENPFLDDRDYILLEPRGGRGASSDLECPAVNTLKGRIAAGRCARSRPHDGLARAAGACAAQLRKAGVDLEG